MIHQPSALRRVLLVVSGAMMALGTLAIVWAVLGVPPGGSASPTTTSTPTSSTSAPRTPPNAAATDPTARPSSTASSAAEPTSEAIPTPVGQPLEVSIPGIDVDAPVVPLGIEASGELEVPADPNELGWWSGGAAPGGPGAAVIVGHVDWYNGTAIFRDLRDLAPGDEIEVRYASGQAYTFRVDRMQDVAKTEFPSDEVYGPSDTPELRLITCSGSFDRSVGAYDQNLIVFASLASTGGPALD
ncbi:MAG: class F sortase [Dehalococcoidia bacterium]